MVIMDSSYEGTPLEGIPPSYLKNGNIHYQTMFETSTSQIVNGVQSIGTSISNGIQSIPSEVTLIKDKIVNRNYFHFDESHQRDDFEEEQQQSVLEPTFISYKDRQSFKPIGIKNNETNFEVSNSTLSSMNNDSSSEKPRFRSFSSPTSFKIELQQSLDKRITPSQQNNGGKSEPIIKITTPILTSTDNHIYNERVRSISLTSIEKIRKIELEKELANEPIDIDDIITYVDFQERIEREELERIEKNSCILSQNCQDTYTGLEIYNSNQSPIFSPQPTSSNSTPSSGSSKSTPRIVISPSPTNSTYSVSLPSTPTKPSSPTPPTSSTSTPIKESGSNSPSLNKLLKRSISATLPRLSKSSSKLNLACSSPPTIVEEIEHPSKESVKSPTPNCLSPKPIKNNMNSKSFISLSHSSQTLPKHIGKTMLPLTLVKSSSNSNIQPSPKKEKQQSGSSLKKISSSLNIEEYNQFVIQESFQNELRVHMESKKQNKFLQEKLERFEKVKSSCKPLNEEPQDSSERVRMIFTFPNTTKSTRYFNINDKVQSMKDYIEYLSLNDTSLFGSRFINDQEYKILDFEISYCLQPTKIKISNFNVSFKDSGFNQKSSNPIIISISQKTN